MRMVEPALRHLASTTFCWLPPLRLSNKASGPGVLMLSRLIQLSARLRSCFSSSRPARVTWPIRARVMFCATLSIETMPSILRSRGM
ncbi:hypothetical protein D3C76_1155380 [compost metagenome]